MNQLKIFLLIALALGGSAFAQQRVGWSLGYYCGWDQNGLPPANINWNAFTHISYFACTPNNDGSLNTTANGINDNIAQALIAKAHSLGKKVVICVGGAGVADGFKNACSNANRGKFISQILAYMKRLGYDGVDTDWEENFDDNLFVAWHKDLRDSLNKLSPIPLLTIANAGYLASHGALVYQYVDQMNSMCYDIDLSGMPGELSSFTNRGVPKKVIGIGIGIGNGGGMVDSDTTKCKGKALFAIQNGCGGIMEWAVKSGALNTQCFQALVQYMPVTSVYVLDRPDIRNGKVIDFLVSNTAGRQTTVSYTVANTSSIVDLSVYNVNGVLVKTLMHGAAVAGSHCIPLDRVATGSYIIKFANESKIITSRTTVIQ